MKKSIAGRILNKITTEGFDYWLDQYSGNEEDVDNEYKELVMTLVLAKKKLIEHLTVDFPEYDPDEDFYYDDDAEDGDDDKLEEEPYDREEYDDMEPGYGED